MSLLAGAAREVITPIVGSFLFGYNNHCVSHSVNDQLTVTALALESGNTKILLLSATVCLIDNGVADEIRTKAGAAAGVPAAQVILGATHTHSGPRTDGFTKWGEIDRVYCDTVLIPKCIAAARAAAAEKIPVKTGIGVTDSKVGINRRQLLRDGKVILGQNPWDVYDPAMTVISLKADNGKTLANLVHVGAHCTAAGINHEISRDWAGVMTDRLEKESGALTLFFNGTAGDVAPRITNGGSSGGGKGNIGLAMELGALAGIDAVRAWKSIKTFRDEKLAFSCGDIKIPFEPPIPADAIAGRLARLDEGWTWERSSLERLAQQYKTGNTGPDALSFGQTVVQLGPAVFVPFPFETSTEIGMRLRNYSPFANTLLFSCTNGSHSYLPAQSQICRGGYEIMSFRWFRTRQLPDNTDTLIIEQNMQLIEKLT